MEIATDSDAGFARRLTKAAGAARVLPAGVKPFLRVAELEWAMRSRGFGEYLDVYGVASLAGTAGALRGLGRHDAARCAEAVTASQSGWTRWFRESDLETPWVEWLELDPPVWRTLCDEAARLRRDPAVVALAAEVPPTPESTPEAPLAVLVEGGASVAAIERVLAGGADPDTRNGAGKTVLARAAGRPDGAAILEALIRAGAALEPEGDAVSPLDEAAGWDLPDNVAVLLRHGGHVTASTTLRAGPRTIEQVVAAGAPLEARDAHGQTPLLLAARQPDLALRLLELGADPNVADAEGMTPLHVATDPVVLEHLLAAGANPEAQNGKGETAAEHHRRQWHRRCVKILERAESGR